MSDEAAIAARYAIEDLISNYVVAMDTSDWGRFRACFLPDAGTTMDRVGEFATCEAVVELYAARFPIFAALQHFVTNVVIDVTGDQARARTYFVSHHVPKDVAPYTYGGTFEFDVVRADGGWRFSSHTIRIGWEAGTPLRV